MGISKKLKGVAKEKMERKISERWINILTETE